MADELKLTANQQAALIECQTYAKGGRRYWWRRTSTRQLEEMGLVEADAMYSEPGFKGHPNAVRSFHPTPAGVAYLSALQEP